MSNLIKQIFIALILVIFSSLVLAQRCTKELEPNNTPPKATTFAGMGCIIGTLEDSDQDLFAWTVTDNDFRYRRVVFEVDPEENELISLQFMKLNFAENGTDVISKEDLFKLDARQQITKTLPQILTEGKYYLGVAGKGSYLVNIQEVDPSLPSTYDREPNDSSEEAREQTGAFRLSGDLEGSVDYHLWTLTEEDANNLWKISAQTQIGKELTVKLFNNSGENVFTESVDENNYLTLYDLGLETGSYTFILGPASESLSRYTLQTIAQGIKTEGQELEPNDSKEQANIFDVQSGISGLLRQGERDDFRFRIDQEGFYKLDLGLEGYHRINLWDKDDVEILRQEGESFDLGDLHFQAGEYYLRLSASKEDTPYSISFAEGNPAKASHEIEPNNVQSYATALDEKLQIRGEMKVRDFDFFSFEVSTPQTFRIQLLGEGLNDITVYDSSGSTIQYLGVSGERRARLDNLVLLPGKHYVEVDGQDAQYALRILSLGPATFEAQEADEGNIELEVEGTEVENTGEDTGAEQVEPDIAEEDITRQYPRPSGILEREPNDDDTRSMPLRFGQNYVGILGNTNDHDYYRFSLQNDQYIRLEATPAEDGLIFFDIRDVPRTASFEQGKPAVMERWLLAGDYFVTVRAETPSYGYYQLQLNQLDSLDLPVDLEPNDSALHAVPLPESLELTGRIGQSYDDDWFLLPTIDKVSKKASDNFELNTNRYGNDYRSFEAENPSICFTSCEDETECVAWTFVKPSSEEEIGECKLKDEVSSSYLNEDTISGVKLAVPLSVKADNIEDLELYIYDLDADAWLDNPAFDPENNLWQFSVPVNQKTAVRIRGKQSYNLTFDYKGVLKPKKPEGELELALKLDHPEIAAYWHEGQRLQATLALKNPSKKTQELELAALTSDARVRINNLDKTVTLKANQSLEIPVDLEVMPDIRDDQPILINVAASDSLNTYSVTEDLQPLCEAPPVNGFQAWSLPTELLGGYNVALIDFGAKVVEGEGYARRDEQLFDGRVSPATGAYKDASKSVFIELVGEEPVTLTGTLLHPRSRGITGRQLKDFEILTSLDGENYESVYQGQLKAVRLEQAFVFTEPVTARYVQLRFLNNQLEDREIYLGEWKLLSNDNPLENINLADPNLGGYVVWSSQLINSGNPILSERPEGESGDRITVRLEQEQTELSWVVGFHHNRAAQIEGFEWLDHLNSEVDKRLNELDIEISLDSPAGPWEPLTTWVFERSEIASEEEIPEVTPLALDEPIWARYVRFKATGLEPKEYYNLPDTLRIFERQSDNEYHSILAEWGHYSRAAVYENLNPPESVQVLSDESDNSSRETAQLMELGNAVSGTVEIEKDIDWYKITISEGQNLLTLKLNGDPTINYQYKLENSEGQDVPIEILEESAESITLQANVSEGDYFLELQEPPRSVVFAWDNSGSMGPYRNTTYSALTSFAQDIQEGREVVSLAVFDNGGPFFIMPDFSGNPLEVMSGLSSYDRRHGSSDSQPTLLKTTEVLGKQIGTKAIMLITDAESGGYNFTSKMWQAFAEVKPRVFTFEVSTSGTDYAQDLMQSWADVNHGIYQNVGTTGQLDVGFARATCNLRRPKGYEVLAEVSYVERGPGKLKVIRKQLSEEEQAAQAAEQAANAPAVEVILDSSGSMWRKLDGRFRYVIANEVLSNLVTDILPAEIPFALRVFGNREESTCRTDLEVPLSPLNAESVSNIIVDIEPKPYAGTPLADSIKQVASDLAEASGPKTVVLITDGEESCDGDVEAEIIALREQDIDVILNIIGFDFEAEDKEVARERFRQWAELGGGQYFDASSAEELELSLTQAATTPPEITFEVLDGTGEVVATSIVDGEEIELLAGNYQLRFLTVEPYIIDVQILAEQTQTLEIKP